MANEPGQTGAGPVGRSPAAPGRRLGDGLRAGWRSLLTWSTLLKLAGLAVPLVAWEISARRSGNRLTPRIEAIWESLGDTISSGDLWFHGRLTLFRGFLGLGIAVVAGVAAGFGMARSRWVDAALQPLLAAVYPIPKLALYPVTLLILGLGGASKVWQVALECFFPMAFTTYAGASSIDRDLLWLARNSGAGRLRTLRDVVFPATLPSIFSGLRIATPLMLVVITVTEIVSENRGLGFLIQDARAHFEPAEGLAIVVVLGIVGFLFDRLIVFTSHRVVFWQRGVEL